MNMPAVAAPSDRRFRRAKVRPSRQGAVSGRHVWLVVRTVTVLALLAFGGWRAGVLVFHSPALAIDEIRVEGNHRLSHGEVQALVGGLRGQNILTVTLDEWQRRLLASPWVEEAAIHRTLPSRIDIVVREREPMGVARLGSRLYLVDGTGIVIDEYGPNYAALDLPVIDGLAAVPGTAPGAVDEQRARLAARVVEAVMSRPELATQVSQINVADPHDAVVMLEDETIMLRLGDEDFADRLQGYLDLAPALKERVSAIDYVDLRFGDRLYVRPIGGSRAATSK